MGDRAMPADADPGGSSTGSSSQWLKWTGAACTQNEEEGELTDGVADATRRGSGRCLISNYDGIPMRPSIVAETLGTSRPPGSVGVRWWSPGGAGRQLAGARDGGSDEWRVRPDSAMWPSRFGAS